MHASNAETIYFAGSGDWTQDRLITVSGCSAHCANEPHRQYICITNMIQHPREREIHLTAILWNLPEESGSINLYSWFFQICSSKVTVTAKYVIKKLFLDMTCCNVHFGTKCIVTRLTYISTNRVQAVNCSNVAPTMNSVTGCNKSLSCIILWKYRH